MNISMLKKITTVFFPAFFTLMYQNAGAQSLSVNTTGATAHPSAILDVSSTSKGLLIPRVSLTSINDVATIAAPATSLLVYNSNAAITGGTGLGYYYFNGTQWVKMTDASAPLNTWSTSGNSGTTAGTHFIGTTDNVGLMFKVNGFQSGYLDVTNLNTGFGERTLIGNTTGTNNAAFGYRSLFNNTTGFANTANGAYSMFSNSTGNKNTANGDSALYLNTTGANNTAVGFMSLRSNISGNENVANGFHSLFANTSGFQNTSVGVKSNFLNTTGAYHTALGYNTGPNSATLFNTTSIGFEASCTANDMVRIGNVFVNSIGGQVAWTTASDGRFKENIKEDVPGLSFITQLRPVTYQLNRNKINDMNGVNERRKQIAESMEGKGEVPAFLTGDKYSEVTTGFIAQEVEAAAKKAGFNFSAVDKPKNDRDLYGLRYAEFVVPLVKGMQEQQLIIEEQKKSLDAQKQRIDNLEKKVQQLIDKTR